jgi:hypothetical protein
MKFLGVLAALLLAGCVGLQFVRADVSVFHKIDAQTPRTFAVRAAGAQASSIESSAYADLISAALIEHGWQPSPAGPIDISFNSGIGDGHSSTDVLTRTGPTPGGGWGVTGVDAVSVTNYGRWFRIEMSNRATGARVYEATVRSEGMTNSVAKVAPCMIKAALRDFPGESGKVYTASISLADCPAP